MDSIIDELWDTMMQTCPILMKEWLNCFYHNQDAARDEITSTLSNDETWKDPSRNFLLRLVSDDKNGYRDSSGKYKPRVQLALEFVRRMSKNSDLTDFFLNTLDVHGNQEENIKIADETDQNGISPGIQSDLGIRLMNVSGNEQRRGNGILHEAAKSGRCEDLKQFLSETNVNATNNIGETALHLAAEFEHPGDVAILLEAGANIQVDKQGCTPLFSAAMAVNPSAEVMRQLVAAVWKLTGHENVISSEVYRLLNQQSDEASGSSTALHIAAGNVNVTRKFLHEMSSANAKVCNSAGDTPFHVAARSTNPEAIVFMLNIFAPSKGGWDVDDVDEHRSDRTPTLLHICATSGNAKAVALLIQHGADLAKGVLQEIVIESVKFPDKIKKLLEVYRAIVDNVVTWRCLEENIKLKTKGSQEYNEVMRQTMIWLITRRFYHRNTFDNVILCDDVILCAIEYGAYEMLHEILHTKDVFRFDISETHSLFDVTDFTRATRAEVAAPGSTMSIDSARDYTEQFKNPSTYLRELVLSYDEWRDKSILEEQPLRELTKPYFRFVQRWYCILGMLQLIYMIFFSHYYMPTTCSLVQRFNVSASNSGNCPDPRVSLCTVSWLWLIWPVILCVGNACSFVVDMFWISVASFFKYAGNCQAGVTPHVAEQWPTKVLLVIGQMFIAISYSTSVFVWYGRYESDTELLPYLRATAMVFLFGWTTNLVFFSGITEKFCVFALVVKDIIVKDIILSFLLVFLFTLLGFSFALHVLSLYKLPSDEVVYLSATVYDVFTAILGTGDYVQNSREQREKAGIYFDLFEIVVICYVCMTAIILLNVLIAMMNHRYDKAKERAENFWRFQMLRIALDLELIPVLRHLFRALFRNDLEEMELCGVCCALCYCYCRPKELRTLPARQNRKFLKVKSDFLD